MVVNKYLYSYYTHVDFSYAFVTKEFQCPVASLPGMQIYLKVVDMCLTSLKHPYILSTNLSKTVVVEQIAVYDFHVNCQRFCLVAFLLGGSHIQQKFSLLLLL
jgi:hypothetical protein